MRASIAQRLAASGAAAMLIPSDKPGRMVYTSAFGFYPKGPLPVMSIAREDALLLRRLLARGPVMIAVDMRNTFDTSPYRERNVVADLPGDVLKDEVVMVGAHFDSWDPAQGAIDDGAGVAAVLETARILKSLGVKARRTIRFAFFSGEEQACLGSRAYIAAHENELDRLKTVLIMDEGPQAPLGFQLDPRWSDARDRQADDGLDREIYRDSRGRGDDPRDALLSDLDLPRGLERELVLDRDRVYELNGEDSRMLAAVGAFRVVPERDLDSRDEGLDCRKDSLDRLVDEGLIHTVSLDGHDRRVTLTDRGRDLLEANRHDRDDDRQQEFYAGVNRPRELSHDAQLYRAYQRAEKQLRDEGCRDSSGRPRAGADARVPIVPAGPQPRPAR